MKNNQMRLSILIFTLLIVEASNTNAQFNDYRAKIGIQASLLNPATEFDKLKEERGATYEPSFMGRVFLRFELPKTFLEFEFGAGYGKLAGQDFQKDLDYWETRIFPTDLRLIISPLDMRLFDIYGFAGVGFLRWIVINKPLSISPKPTEQKGWTAFIPFGLGFDIKLDDAKFLELTGGYTHTFSDDINYFNNIGAYQGESTSNDGYYHFGVSVVFVSGSGLGDNDKDGLTNREEKELGTDPNNPDTDGDGLKDGEEIKNYMTNPLSSDTDGDGLSDGDEITKFNTDPAKVDTDGDGLSDYNEVIKYKTDPLNPDSDGDGLSDGEEVTMYLTNPLLSDTDGDGLSDSDEVLKYKTNPLKADTDGDTLTDGDEILKYNTDPLDSDSDGDGLSDSDEINIYKTNPMNSDTDNGSVSDFIELERGTNPLNPEDDVIKINVPIVLEGITFKKNKADITPESEVVLMSALNTMLTYPDMSVLIGGHTDDVGNKITNQFLSQRRAESVRAWLISKGIDAGRITAVGFGEESPRVPNDSEANKLLNRRIEFIRIK